MIFIGTGPYLEECKRYVVENGLSDSVFFKTEMRHELLPDFYRSIDLFVLPSYFEGFGCVFTEAWSCGTPFITCEGQGMDDMVSDDERKLWLVSPKDDDGLSKAIANWISKRPVQHLKSETAIQPIIDRFVEELEMERMLVQKRNCIATGGMPQ